MSLQTHAFRLSPQQDLKVELAKYCKDRNLKAATVISGVGSLKAAELRLADGKEKMVLQGPFEVLSLTGTLGLQGLHLHISIADRAGKVLGGHLLDGCVIHTTAEIVLLEITNLEFKRELDPQTGFKELLVARR
jgi:predicted DNA-binding protein with PD1-like motif